MTIIICLLVACLTSQQHASVSQGRIYSDNCTCCHAETEAADQTFYLTQSQYTDTGPTSPSDDPTKPGAWQGSHWSANFEVTGMTRPGKIPSQAGFELRTLRFRADALTTWPTRRCTWQAHSDGCPGRAATRHSGQLTLRHGQSSVTDGWLVPCWCVTSSLSDCQATVLP